jgi:hypothetical protein
MIVANPEVGASNGHPREEDARLSPAELLIMRQGVPGYEPITYRSLAIPASFLRTIDRYIAGRVDQLIKQHTPRQVPPPETSLWADEVLFGEPVGAALDPELALAVKVARAKWRRLDRLRSDIWWHEAIRRRAEGFGMLVPSPSRKKRKKRPASVAPLKAPPNGQTVADERIIEEMERMRQAGEAASRWKAAHQWAPHADPRLSKPENVWTRLHRAHARKYPGKW